MAPLIVQKLKCKEVSEEQIKVKCLDNDGNEVTEYLPCIKPGDPLKFFFDFFDEANILEECHLLHVNLKTKCLIHQALSGQFTEK